MTSFDAMEQSKFTLFEIKHKKDKGKSFVWQHFGHLVKKSDGQRHDQHNVYCLPCFNNQKLKMYKDSVSTGNLSQHLRDAHGILLTRVLHGGRFIQTIAFVRLRN